MRKQDCDADIVYLVFTIFLYDFLCISYRPFHMEKSKIFSQSEIITFAFYKVIDIHKAHFLAIYNR